jgi:hypothetical protein
MNEQQLRGWSLLVIGCCCCCGVMVPNVHAPSKAKTYGMKGNFYEEQEHVFRQFPKYHMKILLCDFDAKVGRGDVFKPTTANESLHEISNSNGVTVANCHIQRHNCQEYHVPSLQRS